MSEFKPCDKYLDEEYLHYVVEYRGNFKSQINKVDYACGVEINTTLAVVAVKEENLQRLRKDVPAIIFIEARSVYVLQDINPSKYEGIEKVKINPYLNLNGKGVLVGMVDSGIEYLNEEFIKEDGTTRIIGIWDQEILVNEEREVPFGEEYTNEQINEAIRIHKNGGDPYSIVPTRDKIGHGTKMAGIIGARGYNGQMQGVANDCEFIVVKLLQSANYKMRLRQNKLEQVPVYSNAEVLAAIAFLYRKAEELDRPLVIYIGVGTQDGSHDGYNITASYISAVSSTEGVVFVSGTGNNGAAEGHTSSYIQNEGEISNVELKISTNMKWLEFNIWVQKPDKMSVNIISPAGEEMSFFVPKLYSFTNKNFFLVDTKLKVVCYDPEQFTGHQIFTLTFTDIKSGIWKIQMRGEYITSGRYDIWLPDATILPKGTSFLNPDPLNTLTIPSTAKRVVTVSYFGGENKSIIAASGRGFNTNGLINPDIAAEGINILTTSGNDNKVVTISGSSAATAIVAGAICLLIQWQSKDIRYTGVYSAKMRSILIYGASRDRNFTYPNEELGFGKLDLIKVLDVLGGGYRKKDNYKEYEINNILVRCPIDLIQ